MLGAGAGKPANLSYTEVPGGDLFGLMHHNIKRAEPPLLANSNSSSGSTYGSSTHESLGQETPGKKFSEDGQRLYFLFWAGICLSDAMSLDTVEFRK